MSRVGKGVKYAGRGVEGHSRGILANLAKQSCTVSLTAHLRQLRSEIKLAYPARRPRKQPWVPTAHCRICRALLVRCECPLEPI